MRTARILAAMWAQRRMTIATAVGMAVTITVLTLLAFDRSAVEPIVDARWPGATEPANSPIADVTGQEQPAPVDDCSPAPSAEPPDLRYDDFAAAYNAHDADRVRAVVGDGTVDDRSLQPSGPATYADVDEWIAASRAVEDRIQIVGITPGDPLKLLALRTNDELPAFGVEQVQLSIHISLSSDCGRRVETTSEISEPDACSVPRLVGEPESAPGCWDPFDPRMGHVATWTGSELLVFGGSAGGSLLTSGLGYRPESGWRDLAPAPLELSPEFATWTDGRLLVVGTRSEGGVVVLTYAPDDDHWDVSTPLPEERYGPGAIASTGAELLFVGGSQNDPRSTAWAFQIDAGTWRQLPDPGVDRENMAGAWTGTEAIFYGGYPSSTDAPGVAYDPSRGTWRPLPPAPVAQAQGHELIWTGTDIISVGGNFGPSHSTRLQIYNPATDVWRESATIPMAAGDHLGVDWTGNELVVWGGYATYGNGLVPDGARYDPSRDTWTVMAPSPLTPRCRHSATATPIGVVVFGGMENCGDPGVLARGDAAVYDPVGDTWTELRPWPGMIRSVDRGGSTVGDRRARHWRLSRRDPSET